MGNMDRQRLFLSFKSLKVIGRAHDERKQHVRPACGQYEVNAIRVPASASATSAWRGMISPIPPAIHNHSRVSAREEDPAPCPEAHASSSVGNVKSPAIPTRELQGPRPRGVLGEIARLVCDRARPGLYRIRERQ